jgi:transcriptional regulator with XRE-family HTH domain
MVSAMEPRNIFEAEDFGKSIRELRRRRGWSQNELAAWLGVTRPTIAKLEDTGEVSAALVVRALTLLGAVPTVHLKTAKLVVADAADVDDEADDDRGHAQ